MRIRRCGRITAAVTALALLASCSSDSTGNSEEGEASEITIVLPTEPDSMASELAKASSGHPILRNIEEALINRHPVTQELVGELATGWEQVEPTRWRFTLREGVTFHDGSPFNAEAAAFQLNRMWDRDNVTTLTSYLGPDMTFEEVDEYTLDVITTEPDAVVPQRLSFSPIASMAAYKEDPEAYSQVPIGTGPYKFVEWAKGQRVVMERYEDWWGHDDPEAAFGEATIEKATFLIRSEDSVRGSMLETDEADLASRITAAECEAADQCGTGVGDTVFLRPDTSNPVLGDRRIREALALAIDKEQIRDSIFEGGSLTGQLVPKQAVGYREDLAPYPYDPERAADLVAEAAADGVPVDDQLHLVARQEFIPRIDEVVGVISQRLLEAGLNVDVQLQEQVAFEEMQRAGKPIPPDRAYMVVHGHDNPLGDLSITVQAYYLCDGNTSTYCNEDVDRLFAEALPLPAEQRRAHLEEIVGLLYDDYAIIPITQLDNYYGYSEALDWTSRDDNYILLKEMSFKTEH